LNFPAERRKLDLSHKARGRVFFADPPQHTAYRALINASFAPKAVAGLEAKARALAIKLVEWLAIESWSAQVGLWARIARLLRGLLHLSV